MSNLLKITIMKKSLIIAILMTIVISANAMSHRESRIAARAMTDKMAYELRLTDRQYHAVYDINLRYIYDPVRKDRALYRVLTPRQYDKYIHHKHLYAHPVGRPVPPHHAPAPVRHHKVVVVHTPSHRR